MSETKALNWSELDAYDRCLWMQTRLKAIERLIWDSCNRGHRGPASSPRDMEGEGDQVTNIQAALRSLAELPDEVIRTAYQAARGGEAVRS